MVNGSTDPLILIHMVVMQDRKEILELVTLHFAPLRATFWT